MKFSLKWMMLAVAWCAALLWWVLWRFDFDHALMVEGWEQFKNGFFGTGGEVLQPSGLQLSDTSGWAAIGGLIRFFVETIVGALFVASGLALVFRACHRNFIKFLERIL